MMLNIYAVRDVKTGFMTPTFDQSDATAIRNFSHAVVNSDTILSSYCKDFALYRLGTYDNDTGTLTPEPLPVHVYEAADALRNFGGEDRV